MRADTLFADSRFRFERQLRDLPSLPAKLHPRPYWSIRQVKSWTRGAKSISIRLSKLYPGTRSARPRLLVRIEAEIPELLGPVWIGITQTLAVNPARQAPLDGCLHQLRSKKRERERQIDLTYRAAFALCHLVSSVSTSIGAVIPAPQSQEAASWPYFAGRSRFLICFSMNVCARRIATARSRSVPDLSPLSSCTDHLQPFGEIVRTTW